MRIPRILYYIPKKFLIKIIFALFLFCCSLIYANAATLTSYNHSYNLEYGTGSCGSSGKYSYQIEDTVMGGYQSFSGDVGTTYDGQAVSFNFDFNYDLSANTYYDVKINAMLNDFNQNISASSIELGNGTSCGSKTLNNISLVSLKKSATSGQYKTLTIRIFSATAVDFWSIRINNSSYSNLTGVSNFGISSLTIEEVDMSNTDAILNNQNSNTDSIINNNNQNTQDIIDNQNQNNQDIIDNQNKNNEELKDSINDSLNNCRPSKNLLNVPSSFSVTSSTYLNISIPAGTYTLSADSITTSGSNSSLFQFTDSDGTIYYYQLSSSRLSYTFTTSQELTLLRVFSQDDWTNSQDVTTIFTNLMLEKGSVATEYEEYGKEVCQSKIDETNDKLDNLTGAITDTSDPNLAMDDVAGWLPAGPVDSVLNLPLTILNSLISNLSNKSCKVVNLPIPYINKSIQLPCLSTIFDKMGVSNVLDTICIPFAIYIYINTLIKLYGWVDKTLSFREEHWNDVDQWGGV